MVYLYIIGLDLSLSSTGVAVYDTEKSKFVHVSSISTMDELREKEIPVATFDGMRLRIIYDYLLKIQEKYKKKDCVVAIERGFTMHNKTTQQLYRVHGVANLVFSEYEQFYYPPKTVKATVYDGTATKEELATLIETRTNAEFMNYDESDACAVALTYAIKNKLIYWSDVMPLTMKKQKKLKK